MKYIIYLTMFLLLLTGCAPKQFHTQNSAFILFKTPTVKYADMGFIYENNRSVKVEIYSSGNAGSSIEVKEDRICLSLLECMGSAAFNREVLSSYYPEDTLRQLFRGKPIFGKEGYEENSNGFTQTLSDAGKYDIHYSVLKNETKFVDKMNAITIKLKRM